MPYLQPWGVGSPHGREQPPLLVLGEVLVADVVRVPSPPRKHPGQLQHQVVLGGERNTKLPSWRPAAPSRGGDTSPRGGAAGDPRFARPQPPARSPSLPGGAASEAGTEQSPQHDSPPLGLTFCPGLCCPLEGKTEPSAPRDVPLPTQSPHLGAAPRVPPPPHLQRGACSSTSTASTAAGPQPVPRRGG